MHKKETEKHSEKSRQATIGVDELNQDVLERAADGGQPLIVTQGEHRYSIQVQKVSEGELAGASAGARVGAGRFGRGSDARRAEEIEPEPDVSSDKARRAKAARAEELERAGGGVRVGAGPFGRGSEPAPAEEIEPEPDVSSGKTRQAEPIPARELGTAGGGVRVGTGPFGRGSDPRRAEEIEPEPDITVDKTRRAKPDRPERFTRG